MTTCSVKGTFLQSYSNIQWHNHGNCSKLTLNATLNITNVNIKCGFPQRAPGIGAATVPEGAL